MQATTPLRTIGTITAPHGLRGQVVMRASDEDAPWVNIINSVFLFFKDGPREAHVESLRFQGDRIVVKFDLVPDRETAEKMKGIVVKALESELPALGVDEYYIDELLGLSVYSADSGEPLGEVVEVLSADAGEYLDVNSPELKESVLVPFLEVFIRNVDRETRRIYVTGLDTLFEEARKAE